MAAKAVPEDAARRYDEAAREHHGLRAVLNFASPVDITAANRLAFGQRPEGEEHEEQDKPRAVVAPENPA